MSALEAAVDLAPAAAGADDRLQLLGRRRSDAHHQAVVGERSPARGRCRRCARPSPSAPRRSCCRSSRRACSDCASRDPGRRSGRGRWRPSAACRAPCPAAPARVARSTSSSRMPCRYFDMSITTATLQHCPARLVPPPRESSGAPYCAAEIDGGQDVDLVPGDHHAHRHLPVVGAVGGVERAAAAVEAHLAVELALAAPWPARRESGRCAPPVVPGGRRIRESGTTSAVDMLRR